MKKILVVVDMQKDFIDGSLGTKEAQAIVPNVIKKINDFKGTVIYTMDTHPADYLETFEGKRLPVEHCIDGTDGWKIHNDVLTAGYKKGPKEILSQFYYKPTFGCTDLADDLLNYYKMHQPNDDTERSFNKNQELEIEVIGLCTDICVISNVLLIRAVLPDAIIRVDASCCAGVTPETHAAALKTMEMCQIDISN